MNDSLISFLTLKWSRNFVCSTLYNACSVWFVLQYVMFRPPMPNVRTIKLFSQYCQIFAEKTSQRITSLDQRSTSRRATGCRHNKQKFISVSMDIKVVYRAYSVYIHIHVNFLFQVILDTMQQGLDMKFLFLNFCF